MDKIEAEKSLKKIYNGLSAENQEALDICFIALHDLDGRIKKENFADNLRMLIYKKKLTQREFAEKCGMTYATLLNYINGISTPGLHNLCQIAEGLEISLDTLIYKKE